MRAHCVRARFHDRSRPCFIASEIHSTFIVSTCKHLIVAERTRPCSLGTGSEPMTVNAAHARSERAAHFGAKRWAHCDSFRSNSMFHFNPWVMKHEGFSWRYDEEKRFRGHSFLPVKRAASSREPPFSRRLASIWNGEGISERTPASKIDRHRRRSTSGRCWAAVDKSPATDIVWELQVFVI